MIKVRTKTVNMWLARRNMRRAQLAECIGITRSYLSQILRGHRDPGPSVRQRLMEYTRLSFDDLFVDLDSPEPVGARR